MTREKLSELVRIASDAHVAIDRLHIAKQVLEQVPSRDYSTVTGKLERQAQVELIKYDAAVGRIWNELKKAERSGQEGGR